MSQVEHIRGQLGQLEKKPLEQHTAFYKIGPGEYAEHDQFLGIAVPLLRRVAKEWRDLPLAGIQELIQSPWNEERLLALFILVWQYQRAEMAGKEKLFAFYIAHLPHVNNWNLVDASAHLIVGAHLLCRKRDLLLQLATSEDLWERRVAIVATWAFIRERDLASTFAIAKKLLHDSEDLIHKAVGWMLREVGKRDQAQLCAFLDQHGAKMPRTMLRYAIEKFPEKQRKEYLRRKKRVG